MLCVLWVKCLEKKKKKVIVYEHFMGSNLKIRRTCGELFCNILQVVIATTRQPD